MIELNNKQRQAVQAGDGPVLIVAGPGTGKTKTLTARIAHLVESGVAVADILALTFTVKAAREMAERVQALLGAGVAPAISTFHALGHRILQEANPGVKFSFVSEADRLAIIRDLPRPKELKKLPLRELALAVSRHKGQLDAGGDTLIARVVADYQQALHERDLWDYDDLLYRAYQTLSRDAVQREAWRRYYRHILIDEFQDTNELQWELMRLIRGTDNLFVIGDPKQSIYGFRGASAVVFERFRQDFPQARQVVLEVNYRSDASIVALASAVFPGEVPLRAHSRATGEVQAVQTLNEYSEADFVLEQIEQGIGGSDLLKAGTHSKGRSLRDFAVLYRTHHVARTLQRRLHDSGIPFQVVGEGSPYEQPEVRAIIGSLRWLAGGDLPEVKGFSASQVRALLGNVSVGQPVSALASAIADALNLAVDAASRQRVAQFVGTLVRYDSQADGLNVCLEHIDHISQSDFYDPDIDAVTLMTIHASKGLEFPHVVVIAAEEGSLPHIRKAAPTDFDEEKRLFYVALTRTKSQLDIVHATKRAGEPREPSRFVAELPGSVLPRRTDPNMAQLQKKMQRRKAKARQATLF